MGRYNIDFGRLSENSACLFLKQQGYKILEKNYRTGYGEIDIIAWEGEVLCFIEVKARSSLDYGYPQESVSQAKQKKIIQSALFYLKAKRLMGASSRFDVLAIISGDAKQGQRFELIRNAFGLNEKGPY